MGSEMCIRDSNVIVAGEPEESKVVVCVMFPVEVVSISQYPTSEVGVPVVESALYKATSIEFEVEAVVTFISIPPQVPPSGNIKGLAIGFWSYCDEVSLVSIPCTAKGVEQVVYLLYAVSYTHLTLPTKRIV